MFKKITLFTLAALLSCSTFAQQNKGMGEVFDFDLLAKTPQKIQVSERSFRDMPASFSLEKYAPTPGTRNLTVENDSKADGPATGSVVPLMVEIKHN